VFIGIDYSLTSPAICIQGDDHSFFKSEFHYLTDKRKLIGKQYDNVTGWEHKEYSCAEQRYEHITHWVLSRMAPHGIENFKGYIEDYSMGSKGRTFHIAENTGLLKFTFYKRKVDFLTIPPTVVKKDFTGKGNAKKEDMLDEFIGRTGVNLHTILGHGRKLGSPETDVVDAWAICLSGRGFSKVQKLDLTNA
jgi:Holliday junction resolvasome RuvABC endonuclease subunit